jgi:hypothetical protein
MSIKIIISYIYFSTDSLKNFNKLIDLFGHYGGRSLCK